jgi:hypothetical protein
MAATVSKPEVAVSLNEVTWNSSFSILMSSWWLIPVLKMTALPPLA